MRRYWIIYSWSGNFLTGYYGSRRDAQDFALDQYGIGCKIVLQS